MDHYPKLPELMARGRIIFQKPALRTSLASMLLVAILLSHAGCFLDEKLEPFYGRVTVPRAQEFHWSDGGLPQTFDPAFAAAPPDTDLIRAIFEGLTDYDPRTLKPIPAVATRWEEADGGRIWTFYLRDDARWSNGEPVTANDFVRSWHRTIKIGELAPHTQLLGNIEGAEGEISHSRATPRVASPRTDSRDNSPGSKSTSNLNLNFGVAAVSDRVLRVRLRRPDMNFPSLVSHPVFRPVKIKEDSELQKLAPQNLISNGAFALSSAENERVLLQRADNYWDKAKVSLERVAFVGARDTESALAAYRAGEVDAVTNAAFEPLAIKLLTPYEDFRRATYGALTYYSFNTSNPPFDDVRVREALALAVDRDRISEDDMDGATEPAKRFLPDVEPDSNKPVVDKAAVLEKDHERARKLFAEAGFPDGNGFPRVRLLINRNEQQRIVAISIASMWKSVLNVNTELIIRNWDEYEASIRAGEYDVVRRGVVMQTTDELTNIRMVFRDAFPLPEKPVNESEAAAGANEATSPGSGSTAQQRSPAPFQTIETEEQALNDLSAMPIYFAASYALVKPYVRGFDSNVLDAPSLKTVRIDSNWKPPLESSGSK